MTKNDILILLAQDCPDVTLTWDWGNFELQVNMDNGNYTYFLASIPDFKIIEEGKVTDTKAIQRIIENEFNQR